MDILNYYQLTEKIASSGQPTERQLDDIAENKYDAVINLAMPDHENSLDNEGSIVTSHGMIYIHIPVPFDAPNESHFSIFSGCMDSLERKKVWVHCIVNARVSAFLYRYLQTNRGLSVEESTTPLLEKWHPQMDEVWQTFIGRTAQRP